MARYIDADELMEKLKEARETEYRLASNYLSTLAVAKGIGYVMDIVHDAPTVDAVPVVRCKDCKHCDAYPDNELIFCLYHGCVMVDDGFCSDGERENDEKADT